MINKKLTIIVSLLILILFGIILRFLAVGSEFTCEETDFINAAWAIKDTGHPVYYLSEQQPSELALWHPPMYVFLLSVIFRFADGEVAARAVNIFFSLLTATIIFLFCSLIIRNNKGKIIGLISATFFLINYFILSSSIQIDIDMLSAFFMFCFVFFILMAYKTNKKYFIFLSMLSLFFAFFNRYIIVIIIYIFIGIYYYFNRELRRDFKKYLLTGLVAFAGFISIWGIYSIFIEQEVFFSFLKHNLSLGSEQFSSLAVYSGSFILNIMQFIRLFTLPAVILMSLSFYYLSKTNSKLIKILLIYSLSILLSFLLIPRPAFGYPRFFMSAFPCISILIGIFLYTSLKNSNANANSTANTRKILLGIISFAVSLMLLIILHPQSTIYATNGLIKATNLPDFLFNILACLPLFFIFFFKDKKKTAIIILIALILSYGFYFNIKLIGQKPYIKETASYIRERTNETEIIIAPKAIGYYSDRKFYINDNNKPSLNFSIGFIREYIKKSYENREMDDEFFWPKGFYSGLYDYPSAPLEENLKKASYVILYHAVENEIPEKRIGKFYIYNLKSEKNNEENKKNNQ